MGCPRLNLLIGGTGFVGGHLVEFLFQQGEISKGTFRRGSHLKIMDSRGVQGIDADILDHQSLHEAMEGTDTVYNLASPMPDHGSEFMRVNTEGILTLLEVATEMAVKTVIHLSTLDVCGFETRKVRDGALPRPQGEYQKAKAEAERLLLEFSRRSELPRVIIIRSARGIGSRDSTFTIPLLRMIESGRVVVPTSGSMSFAHPLDIAKAMYCAASGRVSTGSIFQMKSFDSTPAELARALAASLGVRAEVRNEGMFSRSRLPPYTAKQLRAGLVVEAQEGWTRLGFSPEISQQAACEEVAKWYRKEPWAIKEN